MIIATQIQYYSAYTKTGRKFNRILSHSYCVVNIEYRVLVKQNIGERLIVGQL